MLTKKELAQVAAVFQAAMANSASAQATLAKVKAPKAPKAPEFTLKLCKSKSGEPMAGFFFQDSKTPCGGFCQARAKAVMAALSVVKAVAAGE